MNGENDQQRGDKPVNNRLQNKVTWKERERLEELREDKRQVDELDVWEENTLRSAHPNWKDPEKFFDKEENSGRSGQRKVGKK